MPQIFTDFFSVYQWNLRLNLCNPWFKGDD